MKTSKSRKLALVIAITMLVLAFSTTGFAAYFTKTLQANYRNITVFVNGAQKNLKSEPFIVDGTTYVPLRDMAEILGNTVAFNPATYRIDITDMGDAGLQYDLFIKDARIKELEAKLNEKEKEEEKSTDLDKLESKILDRFDYIDRDEKLEVTDVQLSGNKDDITVKIYVKTRYQDQLDAWNKLRDSNKIEYLQDVVDYILRDYSKADISGYIRDEADNFKDLKFDIDRDQEVRLR